MRAKFIMHLYEHPYVLFFISALKYYFVLIVYIIYFLLTIQTEIFITLTQEVI